MKQASQRPFGQDGDPEVGGPGVGSGSAVLRGPGCCLLRSDRPARGQGVVGAGGEASLKGTYEARLRLVPERRQPALSRTA